MKGKYLRKMLQCYLNQRIINLMPVFLLFIMLVPAMAFANGIEVYSGGQKYDSLEAYKALREAQEAQAKLKPVNAAQLQPGIIIERPAQPAQVITKTGTAMGLDKMKTIVLGDAPDTLTVRKLKQISINPSDQASLLAHPQSWRHPQPMLMRFIKAEHLEEAIHQAMAQSTSAKMIISKDNAVKILSLTPSAIAEDIKTP